MFSRIGSITKKTCTLVKKLKITKRRFFIFSIILISWTTTLITYVRYESSKDDMPIVHGHGEIFEKDIDCHYDDGDDALPPIDEDVILKSDAIFFHESSCRQRLDPRQACSIEASARTNFEYEHYVLFAGPLNVANLLTETVITLRNFSNVNFFRIHMDQYVKGTLIEWIATNRSLNMTKWPVSQTSDIMRYVSLYKFGGVSLDLDMIAARPFSALAKNWAAKEDNSLVGSAALAFSDDKVGWEMAESAIISIAENFFSDRWTNNGPDVITRILKYKCNTSLVSMMTAKNCSGFEVYHPSFFYPVHWNNREKYFVPGRLGAQEKYAYGYHMWNSLTEKITIKAGSPYAKLAEELCPSIYALHSEEFGGVIHINKL